MTVAGGTGVEDYRGGTLDAHPWLKIQEVGWPVFDMLCFC